MVKRIKKERINRREWDDDTVLLQIVEDWMRVFEWIWLGGWGWGYANGIAIPSNTDIKGGRWDVICLILWIVWLEVEERGPKTERLS